MIGLTVFMYVFFAILAIGTIAVCLNLSYKRKEENRLLTQEKEILKSQYDQSRKEKIDIEEKANNALAQERTFKVAYEDWKSKYENLESKYIQTRKEMDQHLANQQISIKSIENEKASKPQEVEQKVVIVPQVNVEEKLSSKMNDNNVESSFVLQELKQILNQHVQIISGIIADEKSAQKTSQAPIPSDPLTLIDGINEEIFAEFKELGVNTFVQIAEASRKDLKKWMFHFEEIDERIIESWPYQAKAILNYLNKEMLVEN
ncbi:MAG: hypothetical protein WBB17_01615 [Saprospiraceae bacterium]|nr:hypothetical protein [Saprospiraceae bacterium]